jgi:hypothetical protein
MKGCKHASNSQVRQCKWTLGLESPVTGTLSYHILREVFCIFLITISARLLCPLKIINDQNKVPSAERIQTLIRCNIGIFIDISGI